jgi:hypothetical protein
LKVWEMLLDRAGCIEDVAAGFAGRACRARRGGASDRPGGAGGAGKAVFAGFRKPRLERHYVRASRPER